MCSPTRSTIYYLPSRSAAHHSHVYLKRDTTARRDAAMWAMGWAERQTTAGSEGQSVLFPIGKVTVARSVLEDERVDVADLVAAFSRYIRGDWGDLDHGEEIANDVALTSGGRIVAHYRVNQAALLTMSTQDGLTTVELQGQGLRAGNKQSARRPLP